MEKGRSPLPVKRKRRGCNLCAPAPPRPAASLIRYFAAELKATFLLFPEGGYAGKRRRRECVPAKSQSLRGKAQVRNFPNSDCSSANGIASRAKENEPSSS